MIDEATVSHMMIFLNKFKKNREEDSAALQKYMKKISFL